MGEEIEINKAKMNYHLRKAQVFSFFELTIVIIMINVRMMLGFISYETDLVIAIVVVVQFILCGSVVFFEFRNADYFYNILKLSGEKKKKT